MAKSLALFGVIAAILPAQWLVLSCTRGRAAMALPRVAHALFAKILGLQVRYVGEPLQGRGVVHVSNHLSYLDVQALGQRLRTRFVAKQEVREWPLLGVLSRLQQTVFVSRARLRAGDAADAVARAVDGAHGLMLFPEGTTSDGTTVLPFKAGLFAPLLATGGVRLQPVRIELLAVDGRPIGHGCDRDRYAYHGDATLVPHLWRFLRGRGAEVRVSFLPPMALGSGSERKAVARAAWTAVAGLAPASAST